MGNFICSLIEPVISWVGSIFTKPPQATLPHLVNQAVSERQRMIRKAREEMGVDCINYYNFAVSGQSGVGKSSFINAILGLDEDDGGCAVGEVETTQNIRCYSCSKWPTLRLWDLPGAGTTRHPGDTYFESKKLYAFDAILILSSDRFLKVDLDILRSAREFKTPCVFVRTKCDTAVESKAKKDKVNAFQASQRFRADVQQSFHRELENARVMSVGSELPPQLFLISNEFVSDGREAYSFYDKKTKVCDDSLSSMDECQLVTLLVDIAARRARRRAKLFSKRT